MILFILYVIIIMLSGAALIDYGFNRINFLIFCAGLYLTYTEAKKIQENIDLRADVGSDLGTDVGSEVGDTAAILDRLNMLEDNVGVQFDEIAEQVQGLRESFDEIYRKLLELENRQSGGSSLESDVCLDE